MYDELFDDPMDEADDIENFHVVDLDSDDPMGYGDSPFCEWGIGDSEGLCIANLYGCSYVGCDRATPVG